MFELIVGVAVAALIVGLVHRSRGNAVLLRKERIARCQARRCAANGDVSGELYNSQLADSFLKQRLSIELQRNQVKAAKYTQKGKFNKAQICQQRANQIQQQINQIEITPSNQPINDLPIQAPIIYYNNQPYLNNQLYPINNSEPIQQQQQQQQQASPVPVSPPVYSFNSTQYLPLPRPFYSSDQSHYSLNQPLLQQA